MALHMENPALETRGVPKADLAGALINSEHIIFLQKIQDGLLRRHNFVGRAPFVEPPSVVPKPNPGAAVDSNVVGSNRKRVVRNHSGIKGPLSSRLGGKYCYVWQASHWEIFLARRIEAQGLTAGYFGDPPPGRSALDKKRNGDLGENANNPFARFGIRSISAIRSWRAPA